MRELGDPNDCDVDVRGESGRASSDDDCDDCKIIGLLFQVQEYVATCACVATHIVLAHRRVR